ncbi:MAG: c-type cytochrome [Phycisphaera sp.]|nr:c-type cytochrome [Phycisphaera sp.]
MNRTLGHVIVIAVFLLLTSGLLAEPPRVGDAGLKLTLFAEHPQIVTPIALEVDAKGRVWVVESHTHFRPKDYDGPPTDRIRIFTDTNADGQADKVTSFYEGGEFTMSLSLDRLASDGWVYVATRREVFRLRDTDGDDVADKRETIAKLDTKGNYPHNGLCGLAFHPTNGKLYFGLGENLGEPYKLIGSDDTTLTGGGEGGNIYRCDPDGTDLERIATGFWNPFGLCFDAQGRLFATDNDPDSSPPCRLLHVVPGGDYGFEFRYGRGGLHPLQAWDGELPGTLGMISGTGEAPCELLSYEAHQLPETFRGRLLVTSWGDHRIEAYQLVKRGASFTSTATPLVTGDDEFRPVGIAVAPDGSIYFSDWVSRSYPLHKQGRIWRLSGTTTPTATDATPTTPDPADKPTTATPPLTDADRRARVLRSTTDVDALLEALKDPDPFIRTAATYGLSRSDALKRLDWPRLTTASQRVGALLALRQSGIAEASSLLRIALRDTSVEVRLVAVRWIADAQLTDLKPDLEALLSDPVMSTRLLAGALAAMDRLSDTAIQGRGPTIDQYLLPRLQATDTPAAVRAMALRVIPPDHPWLTTARLKEMIGQDDAALRLEAVRTLASRTDADRLPVLADVARNTNYGTRVRAEAVAGLASAQQPDVALMMTLATGDDATLAAEGLRGLLGASLNDDQRAALKTVGQSNAALAALSDRVIGAPHLAGRPDVTDTAAWVKLLEEKPGDAEAGRRVFFHAKVATCSRCHTFDGRGAKIGPDLSPIGKRITTARLVESILQPSKEVAPYFYPYAVTTDDGNSFVGFSLADGHGKHTFKTIDGREVTLDADKIKSKTQLTTSIMPPGLHATMTIQEFRDLIAFLMRKE